VRKTCGAGAGYGFAIWMNYIQWLYMMPRRHDRISARSGEGRGRGEDAGFRRKVRL